MIKLGKSEVVNHVFYLDDAVADAGVVEVTVKDSDDYTLYSGPTIKTGDVYSFTLPAQSNMGNVTIQWNGTILDETTTVEIAGDYLFELADLKQLLNARGLKKEYSNDYLRSVRDQVTELFESVTNRGFIPRRRSERAQTYGGVALLKRADVRQVLTVDGSSHSGGWTPDGVLTGLSEPVVSVTYDYGLDLTAESTGAALELAVYLTGTGTNKTPANAESLTDDSGTYRLVIAGIRGIDVSVPNVQAFLNRHKLQMPGVA